MHVGAVMALLALSLVVTTYELLQLNKNSTTVSQDFNLNYLHVLAVFLWIVFCLIVPHILLIGSAPNIKYPNLDTKIMSGHGAQPSIYLALIVTIFSAIVVAIVMHHAQKKSDTLNFSVNNHVKSQSRSFGTQRVTQDVNLGELLDQAPVDDPARVVDPVEVKLEESNASPQQVNSSLPKIGWTGNWGCYNAE